MYAYTHTCTVLLAHLYSITGNRSLYSASCNMLMTEDVLMATLDKRYPLYLEFVSVRSCSVQVKGLRWALVINKYQRKSISRACGDD